MSGLPRAVRDRLGRLLLDTLAAATPRRASASSRTRIGVFLFWGVGDAVLAVPFLRALRDKYPQARIEAFGKPWLQQLLGDEGLFDRFHDLVPPWTKHTGKYRLWAPEWRRFRATLREIAQTPFDLLVSLRPDPRETLLSKFIFAAEFAGYAAAGGDGWITTDLGHDIADEAATYRGELAAQAAQQLLGAKPAAAPALLPRAPGDIVDRLADAGYREGPVMALSFGAAHPLRRWQGGRIAETLRQLRRPPGAYLVIESPDAPPIELPDAVPSVRWHGSLRDLKRALSAADVLLCTDSGVMHMGAALGCRTVSVFGPGSIARFAPVGPLHSLYAVEPMPCRPCYDNCIYPSPLCMDRIETTAVARLADQALASVAAPRIART